MVPVGGTCPRSGRTRQRATAEGRHPSESRDWLAGPVTERRCCLRLETSSLRRLPSENLRRERRLRNVVFYSQRRDTTEQWEQRVTLSSSHHSSV